MTALLKSRYTFINKNKIIYYAIEGNFSAFDVDSIKVDGDKKTASYELCLNYDVTTDQFLEVANRMNQYLYDHPSYFLNDGYQIELMFNGTLSGPSVISFYNWNIDSDDTQKILYDGFYCMHVYKLAGEGLNFNTIQDFSLCRNINAMILDKGIVIENVSVLKEFESLTYLGHYDTLSEEQATLLKGLLPQCKIVDYNN